MAYYLAIKEKKGYKLLDISILDEFTRLSKFKKNSYSLEEIDKFTSKFESEVSLKSKLYSEGIIEAEDIIKEITIRRKSKNELIKVKYGLIYRNMKKYLDIYYLRNILLELQNDKEFLNKLLEYYRNSHNQESIAQIRALLLGYDGHDISIYNALSLFFRKEIFDEDYKTGQVTIKYKSLHDLAMFIYNYLEKKNKISLDTTRSKEEIHNELINLQSTLTSRNIIVKKVRN